MTQKNTKDQHCGEWV